MTTAAYTSDGVHLDPVIRHGTGVRVPPHVQLDAMAGNASAAAPGALTIAKPPAATMTFHPGSEQELFGKLLFKPTYADVGFILNETQVTVEAWNTDRSNLRVASIENSDPDGLRPLDFGVGTVVPRQTAKTYHIVVNATGKSRLDETVALLFQGKPANAAKVQIVGTRLVVFPIAPDWGYGIKETETRLSSLLTSYRGKEQRAQLREVPERQLTYTVSTLTARETAHLDALLYSWQARVFGVPIWADVTRTTDAVAKGATFVPVATEGYEFKVGGFALLYADQFNSEAVEIADLTANGLTLVYKTGRAWPTGAQIVPMTFGRMNDTATHSHDTATMGEAQLTFTLETI